MSISLIEECDANASSETTTSTIMSEFNARLQQTRKKLLDLTKRNKLISYKKPAKTRHLKIIDESPDFIYNRLVLEEGEFKFKYIPEPEKDSYRIKQEEFNLIKKKDTDTLHSMNIAEQLESLDSNILLTAEERAKELGFDISNELPDIDLTEKDVDEKYIDDYLQTLHYPSELEKILKKIDLDARGVIQETGANMLYLILGVLEWTESSNSDIKIKSPLVNIPVTLSRGNLNKKTNTYDYVLKYDGDGIDTNRSLAEKLYNDFNIVLPELTDQMTFNEYIREVSKILLFKKDWKIKQEIALDFLNFSKILMYKDLEDTKWEEGSLLSENFILQDLFLGKETGAVSYAPSEYDIDANPIAKKIPLVMDADSSQHSAIVDVIEGKNLVVEGPPGTGKSQTISNMIAALLAEGKSVLFVSEKLAALEVVFKRLSVVGLEDFCLELHSHKSQKTKILDAFAKRINGQYMQPPDIKNVASKLEDKKKELNEYLKILHSPFGKTEQTLFEIFWIVDRYHDVAKYLKFEVENAENETLAQFNHKIEQLSKYQIYINSQNLDYFFWNSYNLDNLNNIDIDLFANKLDEMAYAINKLVNSFTGLADQIGNTIEDERTEAYNIEKFIKAISIESLQICDFSLMVEFSNNGILEKVGLGSKIHKHVSSVFDINKILSKNIKEVKEMKMIIELKKDSFFNFLSSTFQKAKKDFGNLFLGKLPKDKTTWISHIDTILDYLEEMIKINATKKVYYAIVESRLSPSVQAFLIQNFQHTLPVFQTIIKEYEDVQKLLIEINKHSSLINGVFPIPRKFNEYNIELTAMSNNIHHLPVWLNYRTISKELEELSLKKIIDAVERDKLPKDKIIDAYYYNFYYSILRKAFSLNPLIEQRGRVSQEFAINEFKKLDLELMRLNRQEIAAKASDKYVPMGMTGGSTKNLTEQKLIEHEISKKKRHIPIRQLVSRAGNAMKALKPCFMMSPLSVAQYLPPSSIKFDVLIVDEASQLRPEEALGVIARASQIVIVGDPKQLPPTSFFDSMKDDSNEDEETVVDESESILDTCIDLYKPIRRLRWHYRSQHESLIDFSNQRFYESDLIVFPSPTSINDDGLGIKHTYIQNSVYQSGINKLEAKIIVEHIERQMKIFPNKSLGVGTFNTAQRDLIQQMLDEKEKTNSHVANFINLWKDNSEPFFIKNLESLQGDERDVIFISTTYGPDKMTGKVFQRFGPINQENGWRRLNVLITRSKQKMHVFTSMTSSDIVVSESSSRGVSSLRGFLQYLETGKLTYSPEIIDGKGFDSPFEESIYTLLNDAGIKAAPQVGVAGYFIDLAVVSNVSNDYVLAIECDGATYHSSKSARDRDRLKQEVLERLGWKVYRIWSTDWFKNRDNEVAKLLQVVREQLAAFEEKHKHRQITSPAHQQIIVDKLDDFTEHPSIKINVFDEIDDDKVEQIHKEWALQQKTYKQAFVSDEKIKDLLIQLRDEQIAKEFSIDARCILSKLMIDQFIHKKPKDMDEFRSKIPQPLRENINRDQTKYLETIFEIIEMADE